LGVQNQAKSSKRGILLERPLDFGIGAKQQNCGEQSVQEHFDCKLILPLPADAYIPNFCCGIGRNFVTKLCFLIYRRRITRFAALFLFLQA
jgi:hypothetical protein